MRPRGLLRREATCVYGHRRRPGQTACVVAAVSGVSSALPGFCRKSRIKVSGNRADFVLGTIEGWDAFGVVRWHAVEEISHPYRYEIIVRRTMGQGPVDLDQLLDSGASFRIATKDGWRTVHGILAEVEEVDRTSEIILYRVLLVPHIWRARHRRRCRNFVGQTLKEILRTVLENRSPAHPRGHGGLVELTDTPEPQAADPSFVTFDEPIGEYRFALLDESRITDRTASPYIVQYNETDFDFLSRLLETEGLSYVFDQLDESVVLSIMDSPGRTAMFVEGKPYTLRRASRSSTVAGREIVRALRDARRIREGAVTMRDYDYHRSTAPLEATAARGDADVDLVGHFEFPAGEESIAKQPALHAATVRLERHRVEQLLREGWSGVRTMEAGRRFTLVDGDGMLGDQDLLAVRVETFASELAPEGTILDEEPFGFNQAVGPIKPGFDSRFLALPWDVPFRPAGRTPLPRIHGVQTAVVTAEEHDGDRPKVNADRLGRVRVRFPWDQRGDTEDGTPTSEWIRVSQTWAGSGYGAQYVPRVGHEVLVAYLQGDPARPVIVGRVYNAQNPPPYDAARHPTVSTVQSRSATGTAETEGFNELRFEDRADREQIYLHAQRNLDEVVRANHTTSVGGDQSNIVRGRRDHEVIGDEEVKVGGDRTTLFKVNEYHTVLGSQKAKIGVNETHETDGFRNTKVGANDDLTIGGYSNTKIAKNEDHQVTGFRITKVGANDDLHVTGFRNTIVGQVDYLKAKSRKVEVEGGEDLDITGDHAITIGGTLKVSAKNVEYTATGSFSVTVGGTKLEITDGNFKITAGGSTISIDGANVSVVGSSVVNVKAPTINLEP